MNPYYDDAGITIYNADCREILGELSDVDLVITSPPYNVGGGSVSGRWHHAKDLGEGYENHDDAMPQADYDRWQRLILALLWATLSDHGAIAYNHKPRVQGGIAFLPTDYGIGLPLRQVIIWDRGTGMNFSDVFFLPKCEWVCIWAKDKWRLRDQLSCQVGDVWRFPPEQSTAHPAPFPVGLPARLIDATRPALVLDPFMGSGTTLRAAKDAGVRACGIEKSERYCEIAAKRLGQEVLDLWAG